METEGDELHLWVFVAGDLTEDEKEALEIASTEIVADFPQARVAETHFIAQPDQPLRGRGDWVFLRYGYQVAPPLVPD